MDYLLELQISVSMWMEGWKRLWCWKGLGAGGEGDDRGWMASLTWWTWVSVKSGSWWWTGRPGVLRFMGSQRVGHDWATDLIWYGEKNAQFVRKMVGKGFIFSWPSAKSWTRLSNFTFTFHFHALKKEMATHSSVLAWRIPGMGESGGLPSMGSRRVGHDWSDLAAAASD